MKINLFTSDGQNWFSNLLPKYPDIEFYENNYDENIEWDIVVVYENLTKEVKIKTKSLILISGEPPKAYYTPTSYLQQFDAVITGNKELKHPNIIPWHQSLPTHIGRLWSTRTYNLNYQDFVKLKKPTDLKVVSIIASKLTKLPGHRRRIDMVNAIIESKLPVDIYGKGRKFVDDKKDAILPYMFHICIENAAIDDYWTEKLTDAIICESIPIYYGCTNISRYFDERCMFIVNSTKELLEVICKVSKDPYKYYNEKIYYLKNERKKLFNKYNIIETILYCIKNEERNATEILLKPKEFYPWYKLNKNILNLFLKIQKWLF